MSNQRKSYLIDKDFQYGFIIRNTAYIVISAVAIFVLVIAWNSFKFKQNYLMLTPNSEQLLKWASEHKVEPDTVIFNSQFIIQSRQFTFTQLMAKPIAVAIFINALISILTGLYFSHRIAGPVFKIKKLLQAKIEGREIQAVSFRKGDYFTELAEMTNEALGLNAKIPQGSDGKTNEKNT